MSTIERKWDSTTTFSLKNNKIFDNLLNLTKMKDYCLGKQLGVGSFGKVREAVHIKTGFKVAIKFYDKLTLEVKTLLKQCVQREI